jgi:hypothetical protein
LITQASGQKFCDVACAAQDVRELAHGAEDAARPDRVAGAHADAILFGERAVDAAIFHRLIGKAQHDEIGAGQHIAPVVGRLDRQRDAVVRHHHLRQPRHPVQAGGVGVYQRQRAAIQNRGVHHLPDRLPAKEEAAGADHDDFGVLYGRHSFPFPQD